MANAFNLTAQLQLQAPTNTAQVANQISRDLNGITVDVQVKANPRQMAVANSQMQGLSQATQQSANNMGNLNRSLSEAARRFSVITIATGSLLALTRSIKSAFGEAIEFERQLIKIEQVTGRSVKQLSGLTKEITKLSTSLGASSKDLLGISRILTQAGFEVTKVKAALDILAKTTLGATFEDIEDTTEGAVAALRQFGDEAKRVGGDIKFLEKTMDAINSVSKNFAVESGDLITVIRRVGGVFEAAGGNVNELIALFTSVRSTTRETAETISTGLRTIFTRLQRTDTVDQLKELGIQLRDSKGQFVGAYEAINRLSVGLSALDPKDYRFSEIVESLGGFRQIGKVIPLIKQFTVAQDALRVAQNSGGSVARDAATAQQSLSVQFDKTREKFDALVRNLADSTSFQTMARLVLKLADAFTEMVGALEPLLPLLLPLMGLKLGRALAPGIGALAGASRFTRRNEGGPIRKFATGGVVPGTGNSDTVPAMLTPGEFVIRKSSVKKLGAETLAQMNNNRYSKGGKLQAAKLNRVVDGDSLNISATPESEPFNTSSRLIGYDAYELNKGTKKERALGLKAKKMAEAEYGNKKSVFKYFKGYGKDKFGRPMYKDDKFGEKMIRAGVATKYLGSGVRATKGVQARKKALGGMIQNFAAGGAVQSILKQNKVGAANLDVGSDSDVKLNVTPAKVKATDTVKNNNFLKNKAGVRKYIESQGVTAIPSYTLNRKSLDKSTGDKFRANIVSEVASAADLAAGKVGQDLIGKPVKASEEAKQVLSQKLVKEGGVIGSVFEDVLNIVANQGDFTPTTQFQPFDFPRGLAPPLADNYTGLPSSFVDSRKKQTSKDKGSFETKVANQIALEAAASPFAKNPTLNKKKLANGGSAGTDTVPALLTPGEFVINKDAARRIGQANLDSMNKKGVARFAKGGSVGGVQRFNVGGDVGSNLSPQNNLNTFDINAAEAAIREALQELGLELGRLDDAVETATSNMIDGASAVQAFAEEQRKFKAEQLQDDTGVSMGGMGNPANQARRADQTERSKTDAVLRKKLIDRQKQLIKSFGRRIQDANDGISNEEALSRAREVVRNQYGELATAIQAEIEAAEELAKKKQDAEVENQLRNNAENVQKAGQSSLGELQSVSNIASSAQQFVFLASAAGGLATQFTGLDDATKKAINQTLGYVAGMIGGIGTIADLVVSITSSIITRRMEAAAIRETTRLRIQSANEEAAASSEVFEEMEEGSGAITKFFGVLGIMSVAVTATTATFKYISSKLEAEAANMGKISEKFIEELNKGRNVGGALATNEQSRIRKEVKQRKTEEASFAGGIIVAIATVIGAIVGGIFLAGGAIALLPAILIGAVAAAIASYAGVFAGYQLTIESATDAEIKRTAAVNQSIQAFSTLTAEQARLGEVLKDIDATEGLTERQKLDQKIEEQKKASVLRPEEDARSAAARARLRELADQKGKSVNSLTEDDFDGEEENKRILNFNKDYLDNLAEAIKSQLDAARRNISTANKLAQDRGIENFDDAQKDPFLKSQRDEVIALFEKARDRELQNISDERRSNNRIRFNPDSTREEQVNAFIANVTLDRQESQLREDTDTKIANFMLGQEQYWDAVEDAAEAQRIAAAAAAAAAKKLEAIADFSNAIVNIFGREVEERKRSRSDAASLTSGGTQDFSFRDPTGLKDLKRTGNRSELREELKLMRNEMPDDIRKQSSQGIKSIMLGASLLQEGQTKATTTKFPKKSGDNEQIFNDFLDEMFKTEKGGGAVKVRQDELYDQMRTQFELAIKKDGISAKEFNEIFKPYIDEANAAAGVFSEFNKLRNMDLDSYAKFIDTLYSIRDKEIKIRGESIALGQKAESFQRQARGLDQTLLSKRSDSLALSRNRLSGIGGVMAGKAKAGNLSSIIGARTEAQERLKASVARFDATADTEKRKKELALQASLQNAIKITTEELGHFADTTEELIKSTLERIDQERAVRATQKGILEEAVVGGGAERRSLARAMFNVQKAFATGTVQNQSPEDRQATFAMLDRFGDVFLPGAGMTGDQLKELLIRSDARRMGLSEEAAMAIFDKTPVEEQLINSVDRLTEVMKDVGNAMLANVGMAGSNVQGQGGGGNIQAMAGPPPGQGVNAPGVGGFFGQILNLLGFATGGKVPVYRNEGGSIFQPKGTDTVPAMLTPGEFVVRKSAVDKVGVGALHAINQGKPLYRANGGPVYLEHGSSGKIKLNPYDEGDKTRAGDREMMDASYKAGIASHKEHEFYQRPDTDREIKRKKDLGVFQKEDRAFDIDYESGSGFKDSFRPVGAYNTAVDILDWRGLFGMRTAYREFIDPSLGESSEDRASRLFPAYGDAKKASDQARTVSNQMKESRTEAGKLDYAAQILATRDTTIAEGNAFLTRKGINRMGPLTNVQAISRKRNPIGTAKPTTYLGPDAIRLGSFFADPSKDEIENLPTMQFNRDELNAALMRDSISDKRFLSEELPKLEAAYKSGGEYRGISFSSLDGPLDSRRAKESSANRDEINARRYNDIKTSIENRIKILKGAIRYDQDKINTAKKTAEDKKAAEVRGVSLTEYYQQERDMANMVNAGIDPEYAAKESQADTRRFAADGYTNELARHMRKKNIGYNRLWVPITADGTPAFYGDRDRHGNKWAYGGMNSGYLAAIDTAISNAKHEYSGVERNETRKMAGMSPLPDKVSWNYAPFEEKLYLAMDEMHKIASLRRANPDYEPRDLAGEYAKSQEEKANKVQKDINKEKFKEQKDNLIKTFSGIGSAVGGAVSGAASTAANTIGDLARPAARINEGRAKASAMFQDLKSKGLSRDEILPQVMDMLYDDGFEISDIDLMLQQASGKQFEQRGLGNNISGLGLQWDRKTGMLKDHEKWYLADSDAATETAGIEGQVKAYQKQAESQKAKNKAFEQMQSESRRQDRREEQAFKDAEGNIINGRGGRPYSGPVDGETPEQKTSRIANNERIMREYHRLRKEAREAEQAKSVKKPLPQKSAINPNAAKSAQQVPIGQIDEAIANLTSSDINIDRDRFSPNQKRRLGRAGVNFDAVDAKNQVMLELFQGGWEKQNARQRKQSLYAKDPGFRSVVGTPQEEWYLGVANQQVMNYGQQLGMRLGAGMGITGLADVYRATGGSINGGMDSVPAMLTPGEFVMSREAVAKHGVGYMKNLNMGKVTGFRRGGVVGTGNVQYRANGSNGAESSSGGMGIMIDSSALSATLNTFVEDFSTQINKIIQPMNGIANQLQGIAESFGSLTMFHTFAGELSMNVNISNKDAIIAAVSDGLLPMIANQIQAQIDASANTFNAGG